MRNSSVFYLGCLTIVLGYAVLRHGGVVPTDWLWCLAGLVVVAITYLQWPPTFNLPSSYGRDLGWGVWILPCYVAAQLPFSVAPIASLLQFFRIVGYAIVFLLIRNMTGRLSRQPWLLAAPVIAIATLEAALGLWQKVHGGSDSFAMGTYSHHSHFSGLLELAFPLAAMYAWARVRRLNWRGSWPFLVSFEAYILAGAAAVIFLGIVYSFSRMGFAASLISLFVMGAIGYHARSTLRKWAVLGTAVGLVAAAVIALAPIGWNDRFSRISSPEGFAADANLVRWRETLPLIAAYPLAGCGAGAYGAAFRSYYPSTSSEFLGYADNDYLQLLSELGIAGFLIAAAVTLAIIGKAIRCSLHNSEPDKRYLALGCLGSMIAILVHSMVEYQTYIPANAMLLAWISGIAAGLMPSGELRFRTPRVGERLSDPVVA